MCIYLYSMEPERIPLWTKYYDVCYEQTRTYVKAQKVNVCEATRESIEDRIIFYRGSGTSFRQNKG